MGTIKRQGIKNTLFTYVGVIIGFVNLIVLMPFVLKTEELGLVRIMYSATILFGTLYPVGLNFLTIRYFPTFKNEKNGNNGYLGLLLLISLCGFFILSTFTFIFRQNIISHYEKNSILFVIYFKYIIPIGFFIGTTTILSGYLNALFKSTIPTFLNEVFIRCFMAALIGLYFLKIIDFNGLMFFYMISYGAMVFFLIAYIIKIKKFDLKINWRFFKTQNKPEIAKYTLLLAFASLASIGIRNIDTLLIGSMIDLSAVAIYSIAFTIGTIIETPVNALGKIADSKISHAIIAGDEKQMKEIYYKSTRYLTILGGFLFLFIVVNIKDGLLLLPEKFHGSQWVVIIVGISSFSNMATGINTSLIYYSKNYIIGTWMLLFMIMLSVVMNLFLIPHYGIIGAAISTSVALIIYNIAKFLLILIKFKFQPYGWYLLKILLIVGSMFFLGWHIELGVNPLTKIFFRTLILLPAFIFLFFALKVDTELVKEIKTVRLLPTKK